MKMTKADRQVLRQSAAVLSSYARCIHESEVERGDDNPNRGKVLDEEVRAEVAEYRALAKQLRVMARRTR